MWHTALMSVAYTRMTCHTHSMHTQKSGCWNNSGSGLLCLYMLDGQITTQNELKEMGRADWRVCRRSGLKVRPLLRTSYQPKQKQYQQQQPKPKPRQQPMQHQSQDSSRLAEAQLRQSQAAAQSQAAEPAELNGHLSAAGEAAAAVAQLSVQSSSSQQHAGTASAEAQQGAAAEPNVATEPQATASQPQAAGMSHEPGGQVKQGAKGKQGKKSKRDYAAWAGATAETRALATAHHDGNPDLETPAVSFGRPRIPKQSKRYCFIWLNSVPRSAAKMYQSAGLHKVSMVCLYLIACSHRHALLHVGPCVNMLAVILRWLRVLVLPMSVKLCGTA